MDDKCEEMCPPAKRKRVVLTLEQKLEVIRLKDDGKSFYDIATKFNIGISTIKDLLKKRRQINEAVEKNKALGNTRKTLREGKYPDVENRLYDWVCTKIEQEEIITNNMLLEKANEIASEMKELDWSKPSKGWLSKFKNRYSLTAVKEEFISESICEDTDDVITLAIEEPDEEIIEEDKPDTVEIYTYPVDPVTSQITPLDAADRLLDFVTEHGFPLKEVITLRMIRDRIIEMQNLDT